MYCRYDRFGALLRIEQDVKFRTVLDFAYNDT